jgi:prepilin-type N-terminal cleavage/methylation domain-containing protein
MRNVTSFNTPAPRARHGFTLFEVLAAALVLALVGTLTIGSMNINLGHLSDARLRLEAGRIADTALADIEATLFDGSAPPIGADETQVGSFRLQSRVTPFGMLFDAEQTKTGDEAEATGLFAIIAKEMPGMPRHIRVIQVKVAWGAPGSSDQVERATIAFDHVGALEALEKLSASAGGEEATE